MADIAAGDVTYTIGNRFFTPGEGYKNELTIAFGDGALTYAAGGVPLTAALMGCPSGLRDFFITDGASATGLVWKYDKANNKLRGYEVDTTGDTDKSMVELDSGSDAPAAQSIKGWSYGF